ncbi:hypothetical protein ACOMHN_002187 [Nucella lapillus]
MFIIVKYGQNESLLCNPSCAVVNLLTSIKKRAGYGNTNLTLDLSDETGLIKELDDHKNENATSLLSSHATYVLLQKDPIHEDPNQNQTKTSALPAAQQFTYSALLEHIEDIFPDFHLRLAQMEEKSLKVRKSGSKTPSPAGRLLSKPSKRAHHHHHRVASSKRK